MGGDAIVFLTARGLIRDCSIEQNVFHSLSIADEAYVLENGRVVLEGDGKRILEDPQVREAYLGI